MTQLASSVPVHPEMEKLESWFADMHGRIFDTMEQAQAAVDEAERTGKDIPVQNEHFVQLKRDFEVAVASFNIASHITAPLVEQTHKLWEERSLLNLHLTQIWAAGTCTLSFFRMLDSIPDTLLSDDATTGPLKTKAAMHMKMWQHLLGGDTA